MKSFQQFIDKVDSALGKLFYRTMDSITDFRTKLSHRTNSVWAFVAFIVLAWLSANQFWDSKHFHSNQLSSEENAGNRDLDFREAVVWGAVAILCFTGCISSWRSRGKLERKWRKQFQDKGFVSQFLYHAKTKPETLEDDFKKWVEINHPELAIWKRPPHSNN